MRVLTLIIFISFCSNTIAQQQDKPSWSQPMPEKLDTPELKIESNIDSNIDFGFERSEMIDAGDTEQNSNTLIEDKPRQEGDLIESSEQDQFPEESLKNEEIVESVETIDENLELSDKPEILENKTIEKVSEPSAIHNSQNNYSWTKIKDEPPLYPQRAFKSKKEGWVDVRLTINIEGEVINTEAVASYNNQGLFNRSALNAVKKWKYEPQKSYGIEGPLTTQVRIVFNLKDKN